MATLERVELYHVRIPVKKPFYPSWIPGYPQRENRFTLIKIYTSDGIEGISAAPEFSREREGLGSVLGPYLIGMKSHAVDELRQRLRELSYLGWRNPWIEPAMWDILAKEKGLPLYQLINPGKGKVEHLKVYASTGEVKDPAQRENYFAEMENSGVEVIKLRVHGETLEKDITLVEKAVNIADNKFRFAVDANQGWPVAIIKKPPVWDVERAKKFIRACSDMGILWVEEPLDMNNYAGLSELKKSSPLPIAGGELNSGWKELKVMMDYDCLHIYQPDAVMSGGIGDSIKVMEECKKRNLRFNPHTWTTGIGLLINLHILASWEGDEYLEYPYEPPGWVPEVRDGILEEPIFIEKGGKINVPQDPGSGIKINKRRLRKYGKRFYVGTPFRVAVQVGLDRGLKNALELKKLKEGKE